MTNVTQVGSNPIVLNARGATVIDPTNHEIRHFRGPANAAGRFDARCAPAGNWLVQSVALPAAPA